MENLIKQIEDLRERINKTYSLLDIDGQESEARDVRQELNKPGIWSDRERAISLSKKAEELEKEVDAWKNLKKEILELEELVALAQHEKDNSLEEEAHQKFKELQEKFEKFEFFILLSSPYDKNNAVLSIHAGTGGTDAQDWTEILERMYLRFSEKKGWQAEILDRTLGNEAGIKKVTMKINGRWAYGYLRGETGVHRLVRISPFDAEAMRHTSFALVEVIPEIPEADDIEIKEEDLQMDTFRASGAGGQHVNKTESAVRITHKPTGIVVTCQSRRSQHQNKETALRILKSKLHKLEEEKRKEKEKELKGEIKKAEWGKQIRSYVMQPYKMVKDHRTKYETQDIDSVLDGNLDDLIETYLRWSLK